MTDEFLDRLLYTDCKPGTGRGAGGGFQVQAQSSGVDPPQSQLAVGWLLYDVQLPWLTQRRAVEDFPLGFAHVGGESYGTAQSRYLGKVATGGRDGNHLADCLLTRDADRYGPVRPAQLWRSVLWRAEPWAGKDCPRFDAADLEPGPLTVEAVADWARAEPEREPALARLVSTLEDPDGRRVVIVADHPDEVMPWVAAATLLLPSRDALAVSVKVFSSAPLNAKHRVVAAPAALFPRIAPGLVSQRFVLDARTCAADEADVSARTAFFTARFTASEVDPYDVVDAVELTDALGGGQDAMLTAWALTKPDETRPEPGALLRWLSGAGSALLGEYGAAVADIALRSAPSARQVRWIDAAVAAKRLKADAAMVRFQLLSAELADIRDGRPVPVTDVLPVTPLDASAHRDAESELSSAILLGTDQLADQLLCLARRHGIEPELAPPMQQRLRDFASGWIERPQAYHASSWALRTGILDLAHDELRHRAGTVGVASLADLVRRLNRYFGDRADVTDPLDRHIQASLIAGGRADRVQRLRLQLDALARLARSTPLEPVAADAASGLQRALLDWKAVDGEVAVIVLAELPDSLGVDPVIAQRAADQLAGMSEKPSRALLELLARLDKQGKAPTSGPLVKVLEADQCVRTFAHQASEDRLLADTGYFDSTVKLLLKASPAVLRARLDDVLAACLGSGHPYLGAVVLASLKSQPARQLTERWSATLGTRDIVRDGIWCAHCLDYEAMPQRVEEQLRAAVREYARRLRPQEAEKWYRDVNRELSPWLRFTWESVFAGEETRPRSPLWINRDGGRA